ncbi:MAG: hypothetical protein IVW54_11725 [Candidatus Binataceae bacterium]|nr:hypothetical protein [Candidatus Binataceae bacterium]
MKRYSLIAVAIIAIPIAWSCRPNAHDSTADRLARTEVIVFRPALPTDVEDGGRCWTESIAVSRPGAWRCMRDNFIFDPCFEISGKPGQVICGADPSKHEVGFILKLSSRLPSPSPADHQVMAPWLIELQDRSICQIATGTMAAIAGEPVRYQCAGSKRDEIGSQPVYAGLIGSPYPEKIWTAEKVWFTVTSAGAGLPFKLIKRETVAIRRVWE